MWNLVDLMPGKVVTGMLELDNDGTGSSHMTKMIHFFHRRLTERRHHRCDRALIPTMKN